MNHHRMKAIDVVASITKEQTQTSFVKKKKKQMTVSNLKQLRT